MATRIRRLSFFLRTIILLVWPLAEVSAHSSCPYGRHCTYDPAPPGRVPPCAMPGLTYCVHTDPYPENLIRLLVETGRYNIHTLLSDESRDDFNSYKKPEYPYSYGPNSLPNVNQISLVNEPHFPNNFNNKWLGHDIFSQKTPLQPPSTVDPVPYNSQGYRNSSLSGYRGYQPQNNYWSQQNSFNTDKKLLRPNALPNLGTYNQNFFSGGSFNPNYQSTDWFRQAASGVTQYDPSEWWKYVSPSRSDVLLQQNAPFPPTATLRRNSTGLVRGRRRRNAELVRAAAKRKLTGAEALRIALGLANEESSAERPRRQAANVEELCQVRTEFITPRAALNNKGSWKYVVNMPDDQTQLVKSEICTSTECNGLCSVPLGYTTRCEQKYIQKRLVALESNGQSLYTDVFWIPSCCQCSIVAT